MKRFSRLFSGEVFSAHLFCCILFKKELIDFFFFGLYLRENEKGKENKNQGKIMSRNGSGRQQKCSMVVYRHF